MAATSSDSPNTVDIPTEKLHPDGEPFDLDYIPGQLNCSSSEVESKLKEFPLGSSGGPSGWRGSHSKEMLKATPSSGSSNPHFCPHFCTRIANGSYSEECMAVITAAGLVPVGKPCGGLRPIAVGDVFRRLAGKLLMESVVAKTAEYLRPGQIGVQVPNAAETAARKVRLWTQEAKSDEVLQVDMRNTFGSVDRRKMLRPSKLRSPF